MTVNTTSPRGRRGRRAIGANVGNVTVGMGSLQGEWAVIVAPTVNGDEQ